MARSTRRTYVRDGRGRFASTGTTTAKAKPAARRAQRGANRITRDNSGRITGVGKNGATARGGRLRTAAGNQRGAVLDRLKRAPMAGTMRGRVRRDPGAMGKIGAGAKPPAKPVATKPAAAKPAKLARQPKATAVKPAPRRRSSAESRLAAAYLRAERIAQQRRDQQSSSYRTNRELRLDAYAIKGKKKQEAALQSPQLLSAELEAQRRSSQAAGSKQRAAKLREAYFRQLSQGKGEKGKVASADRKRYDMLRESAYRLGQQISMDSHNLAYNTNSMGYKESERVLVRNEGNRRKMQRMQALIKRLANVSSISEAPVLPSAQALGRPIRVARLKPGRRSNTNRSSGAALTQSMPYVVRRDGRLMSSIYPKGQINQIRAKRAGGSARLRKPAPKPPQPAKLPTGRTVYRTKAQAIRAQQARTNALGRRTADRRGFNQATVAGMRARMAGKTTTNLYESAPRTVIGRPRVSQLTLSGRVERVGAGRFRTIGERRAGGTTSRPRKGKPKPVPGSKAYKRELQRLIQANGGKDVAAFHL